MRNVVFNFSKPSPESTVASNRIALFASEVLNLPLLYDGRVASEPSEVLIIVNGAFAFCKHLAELGAAVERAKRVVWVQNDYTISPPKPESEAGSPFRRAFRNRAAAGLPPVDYWTTVENNSRATRGSAYVNWNSLTYEPIDRRVVQKLRAKSSQDLFYYGAFREKRIKAFDRYFENPCVPVTISSTSDRFAIEYSAPRIIGGVVRSTFFQELTSHGLGLYIEDDRSHWEFHSPANRFYEMLSAGLPMVFQPEAAPMLAHAGIDVNGYIVENGADLHRFMKSRERIGREQFDMWHAPHKEKLRRKLRGVYKAFLMQMRG